MSEVQSRNSNSLLDKAFSKINSPIRSAEFNDLFESMNAERKNPSDYEKSDGIDSAIKMMKENTELSIKLLLSAAKHQGIDDQDGSKAKEMSDNALAVSNAMGQEAMLQGIKAEIDAKKNSPVNLNDLEGKIIDYKDDTRKFTGENVVFNYKVTHSEESTDANINLTFTIKNQKGLIVKTIKQSGKAGEHQLNWDGTDEKNKIVEYGIYTIEIKADGSKKNGDRHTSFPVTASATLSGIVDSVKIEKGNAVGLMINGHLITRDQIKGVSENKVEENIDYLKPDLLGKNVELDFSRAQVKNGILEVYFNNHVESATNMAINIYDLDNKFIKTLNSQKKLSAGIGKITFDHREAKLEDGNYIVKTFVKEIVNPEADRIELAYDYNTKVVSINYSNKEFKSIDEEIFSAHNIISITTDYLTPIEERRQCYFGKKVTYRDDIFKFTPNAGDIEFLLPKPQEDGVISYGQMAIYDEVKKELVQIIEGDYKPYYLLDDASQIRIQNYINGAYHIPNYADLNRQQRNETNIHIENEIKLGNISLQTKFQIAYDQGQVLITFPAWDGTINNSDQLAKNGGIFRREFTPIYARENGSMFAGATNRQVMTADVESVDEEEGDLILNMVGGNRVPEEMIIRVS